MGYIYILISKVTYIYRKILRRSKTFTKKERKVNIHIQRSVICRQGTQRGAPGVHWWQFSCFKFPVSYFVYFCPKFYWFICLSKLENISLYFTLRISVFNSCSEVISSHCNKCNFFSSKCPRHKEQLILILYFILKLFLVSIFGPCTLFLPAQIHPSIRCSSSTSCVST